MNDRLMPKSVDLGRSFEGCIGEVILHSEDNMTENPCGLKSVMGYFIPTWQRPLVWTQDQNVKLIESIWLGLPIGTYTFNRVYGSIHDNILIDGQQRMNAIELYVGDAFKVFGYYYSEITKIDKRWFRSSGKFGSYITESKSEEYLKGYYNMMNFSGTAHTDSQRA
tara:strand:+ start:210 stop:707 length:498 start_codon:yes stop_codon:yes gene_type:complete